MESDIRNAIVSLIQGVDGAGKVYNRLRKPENGQLAAYTANNVDDGQQINVVFVRRVAFNETISEFDDNISSSELYELYFYRGVVDALNGNDSESAFQLFLENVRTAFKSEANQNLSINQEGYFVSQGGLSTASPLIDTTELGGFDCHRFIGRLTVSIEQC